MTDTLESIREFISYRIREGFESAHEIIENASNFAYETHGREDLQPEIKRITVELIASHQSEQSGWVSSTDCDRLNEAFESLNRQGIVARQDFSCCNNCGFTEIWDEIEEEEKRQPIEGYVFYHLQGTEQVIKSGQLLMAYGCVEENLEVFHRVANKIVEELRRVGLNASWQGTAGHPIVVDDVVWHRRR